MVLNVEEISPKIDVNQFRSACHFGRKKVKYDYAAHLSDFETLVTYIRQSALQTNLFCRDDPGASEMVATNTMMKSL